MLSAASAAGPLLAQPARTVVTIAMSAMLQSADLDVGRLRDIVRDWWDHPVMRRAPAPARLDPPAPTPTSAKPRASTGVLGVKAAGDTLASDLLPPALREMAARMGGVPAWWNGSGSSGEVTVPDTARVGKLARSRPAGEVIADG